MKIQEDDEQVEEEEGFGDARDDNQALRDNLGSCKCDKCPTDPLPGETRHFCCQTFPGMAMKCSSAGIYLFI